MVFLGLLLTHISVNVLNDYFDYRSGMDLATKRIPFSGGSGLGFCLGLVYLSCNHEASWGGLRTNYRGTGCVLVPDFTGQGKLLSHHRRNKNLRPGLVEKLHYPVR